MKMHMFKLFLLALLAIISHEVSAHQPHKALVAPITKDTSTSLYTITLNSKENYVIDLDAPLLWSPCPPQGPPIRCGTPACDQAMSYLSPLCPPEDNNRRYIWCQCMVTPVNPVTKTCVRSPLTTKNITISWTDGHKPTVIIDFQNRYTSCAPQTLLRSLPRGVKGVAGLSRAPLALPSQFSPPFLGVARKFGICLPSTPLAKGAIFFGNGPYYFSPTNLDATERLAYTPLIKHPKLPDYYIDVKAISVSLKNVGVQAGSLALDYSSGYGGVKLSTVVPYTTLRHDVYKALLKGFSKATKSIPRAKTVKPFDLCLNTRNIMSRVGLMVPPIDLELSNGKNWTIYGVNSMKQVSDDVACFAFKDGGKKAEQAVVIGSYQMENIFVQFDLDQKMLGFSSSLIFERNSCGNFNFGPKA